MTRTADANAGGPIRPSQGAVAGNVASALARGPALLVRTVVDPAHVAALSVADWEALVATARRNTLLAYVATAVERAGLCERVPDPIRLHLDAIRLDARRTVQLAHWELNRVRWALRGQDVPLIALKGAAYLLRGLAFARSRKVSDVDLMLRREDLGLVEQALLSAGWEGVKSDAYDQRYYREWMHELPPLQFPGRTLGVDLHHTIAPPVSRLRPDADRLWEASTVTDYLDYRVLAPEDTLLHAAVHLYLESEFLGRFRDLVDLHELALAFARDPGFWDALVARAREQRLLRPLHYAVSTLVAVLGTPVPTKVVAECRRGASSLPVDRLVRAALRSALVPLDPETWPPPGRSPRALLLAHSHWVKMPPRLLVSHLLRKAVKRDAEPEAPRGPALPRQG